MGGSVANAVTANNKISYMRKYKVILTEVPHSPSVKRSPRKRWGREKKGTEIKNL